LSFRLAMSRVERRLLRRQPVATGPQLQDAGLPYLDCGAVVRGRAGGRGGLTLRDRGLVRGHRFAQARDLGGQPLCLGLLPARFADDCLKGPGGRTLRLLGSPSIAGGS
jgi:hypothetical protein